MHSRMVFMQVAARCVFSFLGASEFVGLQVLEDPIKSRTIRCFFRVRERGVDSFLSYL